MLREISWKRRADYATAARKVNKMYQAAIDRIAELSVLEEERREGSRVYFSRGERRGKRVERENFGEDREGDKIVRADSKSSLSSSGGEDSDGDGSNRGDSNSESLEEEEEEEENNSAKAYDASRSPRVLAA